MTTVDAFAHIVGEGRYSLERRVFNPASQSAFNRAHGAGFKFQNEVRRSMKWSRPVKELAEEVYNQFDDPQDPRYVQSRLYKFKDGSERWINLIGSRRSFATIYW